MFQFLFHSTTTQSLFHISYSKGFSSFDVWFLGFLLVAKSKFLINIININ